MGIIDLLIRQKYLKKSDPDHPPVDVAFPDTQTSAHEDVQAKLLAPFANQGIFWKLPGLNFPSGKFPAADEFPVAASTGKQTQVFAAETSGDNLDQDHLSTSL
jgi:hypothetical protein